MSHPTTKPVRRIFLAEDDIDDQELLEDALHSLDPDIKLVSFTSGVRFLHQLEDTQETELPCLIVLDYNIPEINGAEILQQLGQNERYWGITKVIWSTSDSEKFKSSCLALGAKDYIIKPSNVSDLRLLAEKFLSLCTNC